MGNGAENNMDLPAQDGDASGIDVDSSKCMFSGRLEQTFEPPNSLLALLDMHRSEETGTSLRSLCTRLRFWLITVLDPLPFYTSSYGVAETRGQWFRQFHQF